MPGASSRLPSGSLVVGSSGSAFILHAAPAQPNLKLMHNLGHSQDTPPIFSAIVEPSITLYQGTPDTNAVLGTGTSHAFMYRGQPGSLGYSRSSRHYGIQYSMGSFEWVPSMQTGTGRGFVDIQGCIRSRISQAGLREDVQRQTLTGRQKARHLRHRQ